METRLHRIPSRRFATALLAGLLASACDPGAETGTKDAAPDPDAATRIPDGAIDTDAVPFPDAGAKPDAGAAKPDASAPDTDGLTPKPDASAPKPDAELTSPPVRSEGFFEGEPKAPVLLALPAVQPGGFDRPTVCAGDTLTLRPPAGQTFGEQTPDLRVLFAPCGIPGDVQQWGPDAILVTVPVEAETGPVWLVSGADAQSDKDLMGARACLTSIQAGSMIPERPVTYCNGPGADAFDPRVQSKLRGVPVPPADAEGGAPAQTRVEVDRPESAEPDVPRCTVGLPSRRAPLVFDTSAVADVQALQAGDDRVGCFESCEQLAIGAGEVAPNVLHVKTPPRIERFLPAVGQISPQGTHRVERGPMTLEWRIRAEEPPAITLERWQAPAENVPSEGSAQFDALWPSQATLVAENACGRVTRTLDIEPVTTLFVQPDHLDLGQADEVEARVIIDAPLEQDLEIALDDTSGGMLRLDRRTVILRAGSTEAPFRVGRSPRAASMPGGASLGTIAPRVADPGSPLAAGVIDAYQPARVFGLGPPGAPVPGPGQVLVRGHLRYRECLAAVGRLPAAGPDGRALSLDADRCVLVDGAPLFRNVRRSRVEIWDQAPIIDQQRAVVETNDDGEFFALVPADGEYDVTVVAASFAGQVNLENDAITWFWKPLRRPQRGAEGATLSYDFDFARADARHFNALDAITRGLEYALDRSGVSLPEADVRFRKTSVVPGSFSAGLTLRVGNATHIWIGAWDHIFSDQTVLHEYGHHMEHANGTYQLWGTLHDGCYATVVSGAACADARRGPGELDETFDAGCWVNSAELAWFEGFPTYFAFAVMGFDGDRALTRTSEYDFAFVPEPGKFCPLAETPHWNHHNVRITGAAVEDYVRGALSTLTDRMDLSDAGGALTREGIERHVFQVFTFEMRDRAATMADFRAGWDRRFPGSGVLAEIMSTFHM